MQTNIFGIFPPLPAQKRKMISTRGSVPGTTSFNDQYVDLEGLTSMISTRDYQIIIPCVIKADI